MDAGIEKAVIRVIESMRENLGDELTMDDLARTARFSKFHFSRIFQRVTGITPGRFLSALRLQKAKQLLVSTDLNVTDISHRVGYTSVGTFSTRFSSSVGISPATYRRLGGYVPAFAPQVAQAGDGASRAGAVVRGRVLAAPTVPSGAIFIGLFPDRLHQGRPAAHALLRQPGPYVLRDVPLGTWHLLVHLVPGNHPPAVMPGEMPSYVGRTDPIIIRSPHELCTTDVLLRPMHLFDPPVLLAMIDVRPTAPGVAAAESGSVAKINGAPCGSSPEATFVHRRGVADRAWR
ncbi:helix-turn-helix domain-containing protein [Allorhizocola rhizosphaerae]|uniref:helix-turn-helix domain-containing protein n=1 Tax=Allorhizocola rhizosphaerae TaxID=1872709 RepID=UPI000E3D5595|nr:helix-turn-helix transcriptional regulator [Allorhizocola rhizosphaerae]